MTSFTINSSMFEIHELPGSLYVIEIMQRTSEFGVTKQQECQISVYSWYTTDHKYVPYCHFMN